MKGAILALAMLVASSALAQTVVVEGKQYSTGYLRKPANEAGVRYFSMSQDQLKAAPESYDSREHDRVTPIKNQGSCGSCWAFARTRALETAMIDAGKSTNQTIDLGEQDTLVNDKTAYGCGGGFMDGRFETDKGVTTEALCPYRGNDRTACNGAKFAKATKWAMIGANGRAPSVDELKAAIYQYGTIAVTVAAGSSFSPNGQGRITSCGGRGLNHMVTLQGYRPASDGGVEFLIGNSWGTSWGDKGYAWSKQGCNQLASVAGDAALFFYVEGEQDPVDPEPKPATLHLPIEVVAYKGHEVALQVRPLPGVKYKWSTGQTGARVFVTPSASTQYTLSARDEAGNVTEQVVKVTLK